MEELPDWFGIPEAIDEYVRKAERATAVVAIAHRREVGLLTLVRHTAFAAEVKALADTVQYEPYVATRAFYAACGFRPLQVFPDLWDPENPALQLVKRLPSSQVIRRASEQSDV